MKVHANQVGRERELERYGQLALSVQASSAHYCSPRLDGLPLSDYDSFDVVLMHFSSGRNLIPSDVGLDEQLDLHFNTSHPTCASAPFCPAAVIERLREGLQGLAGNWKEAV